MEGYDGGYGSPNAPSQAQEGPTTQQQQHQQFLGDASGAIPNFGEIDVESEPLPEGITMDHIHVFQKMYREHAEVSRFSMVIIFTVKFLKFRTPKILM